MKPLRVLIVEDSEDDSLLLIRELRKGGYDVAYERVETQEFMKKALERPWDVVISDYVLPVFSGPAALNVLKESNIDLPFIVVSGAIGEDIAVDAMKAGAHDYIMKGNLKRLVPAVERELKEAVVRRERKKAEDALKNEQKRLFDVLEILPVYVTLLRPDYRVAFANRFFKERFGEYSGRRYSEFLSERSNSCEACEKHAVLKTGEPHHQEWDGPDGRCYDAVQLPFTDTDGSTLVLEVGIDITERKRAEEQLRRYMERLEQSNRDLEDFAHLASHDLQEPARKLQTFADLIGLHRECMDDKGRDYLERMKRAAQRMQDLILELLRYSGVISELAPFTRFNLKEVVEEAVADLSVLREEVGGRIEVGELPDIEADRGQMRKLFQNLIDNGLKYHGEQKPVIRIYAEPDSDSFMEIHVKDNGIGFEETYLDKIFKPFQRLHAREESYAGTGMGLAICRRIAERHEGGITARSKPGEGATFIVRLPKKQSEINRRVQRDRLRPGPSDLASPR